MNGITIINTTDVYKHVGFATYGEWFIVAAAIILIISIIMRANNSIIASIITAIISSLFAAMAIGMSVYCDYHADTFDYTEYDILIDDSISYNEFVDKYEVLDKDGNIYTVRERTQSNNTEAQ